LSARQTIENVGSVTRQLKDKEEKEDKEETKYHLIDRGEEETDIDFVGTWKPTRYETISH